jgi:site-specific DNA-methyltransferase (adenine-specific)
MTRVEHLANGISMVLGDCREILPTITEVDHVLTDPPYEDELHEAMGRIKRTDGQDMIQTLGFDGINESRDAVAKNIVETSSGWAIIFCLAEGVRAWRDAIQAAEGKYDTTLAWIKPDASPRFNGQGAARGFECAVTAWCGKGHRRWNGGGKRGVFTHAVNPPGRISAKGGGHPTEKPLSLMCELVTLYTDAGDLICDPFCGSGTTGVAAAKLGRQFVGVEKELKWFDLSCKRISAALQQRDLFVIEKPMRKQERFLFDERHS